MLKVKCFGSRGSIPSPTVEHDNFYTKEYGGNTTNFFVEAGPFNIMVDMGSGSRMLGHQLMKDKKIGENFILLFTHYHWDHIQGIGFHIPLFIGSNTFHIHGFAPDNSRKTGYLVNVVEDALSTQQEKPFFPVPHQSLPAKKKYVSHNQLFSEVAYYKAIKNKETNKFEFENTNDVAGLYINPYVIKITTIPLNHQNGCIGYRIDYCGKSVAFCFDNEPFYYTNNHINTICKDVDMIVLDGQYTSEQLAKATQGYGHGEPRLCIDQAIDASAKKALITHHDPYHDDDKLKEMEDDAIAYLKEKQDEYEKKFEDKESISDMLLKGKMKKPPESVEFAREGIEWIV